MGVLTVLPENSISTEYGFSYWFSGLMDLTRSSNIGLDSFSDNVRFLFSRLVDTTCGESVEEKQKEASGVV